MLGVATKGRAIRTSALDYFGTKHKFSFICNRALDGDPWTPKSLERKIGKRPLRNLVSVVALVTHANLEVLMGIVEEWNAIGVKVIMTFPTQAVRPALEASETCFGIPLNDCYERHADGWTLIGDVRKAVAKMFKGDRLVRVER